MRYTIILLLVLAPQVLADQITLKNGDRLTGKVVKSDGKKLTFKAELAGEVAVPWEAVEQIASDEPLYLTLNDGQVVVGKVVTASSRFEVTTQSTGTVNINKDTIQAVRSQAEQTAYLAEIERLRNPRLLDFWSGNLDVGLGLTQGNSDTTTFSMAFAAARTTPRDKISVYAAAIYSKSEANDISVTTANVVRGGARYEFNLTPRLFAFANGDLEHNETQNLDLRLILGGGLGYHVIKNERTRFDLFGGAALNKEYFSNDVSRTSADLQLGEELWHQLTPRVLLKERLVFFPNLSDGGEYRVAFDASVMTTLSRWLGWHITVSDRYISNPLPGFKGNDLILTTGLRVNFPSAVK